MPRDRLYDTIKRNLLTQYDLAIDPENTKSMDRMLNEAARKVENEMAAYGPDPKDLDSALKQYWDSRIKPSSQGPKTPKFLGKTEVMQERMEYSKKCRKALLSVAKREARRKLILEDTSYSLFPNAQNRPHPGRWMGYMVKMPQNEAEKKACRLHNESVLMLAALGQKKIEPKQFEDMRIKWYKEQGFSNAKAQEKTAWDAQNVNRAMYKMITDMVDEGKAQEADAWKYSKMLVDGTVKDVEQAYHNVFLPSTYLQFVMKDCVDELKRYSGAGMDEKSMDKYVLDCQAALQNLFDCELEGTLSANPYYAILDPAEIADSGISKVRVKENEDAAYGFKQAFVYDCCTIGAMRRVNQLNQDIAPLGLIDEELMKEADDDFRISIFKKGNSRIIMVRQDEGVGFNYKYTADWPGRLVDSGLDERISKLSERVPTLTNALRGSSPEFQKIEQSLEAMKGAKLGDDANDKSFEEMNKKLSELLDSTTKYLDRKAKDNASRDGKAKNPYEEKRIKFAEDVQKLANDKIEQMQMVASHKAAMAAMKKTEYKAQQANMPGENVAPELNGLTERERQMKKALENNNGRSRESQLAKEAAAAAKAMMAKKKQRAADKSSYDEMKKSHARAARYIEDTQASPEDKISGYVKFHQQQSNSVERNNTPENTKQINDHARRALAGATLSCMMALESRDKPILRNMVEKGGTEQLIRMVMNNKGFQDRFATVNAVGGDEKQSLNHMLKTNANFAGPVAVGITKNIAQAQKSKQEQKQMQKQKQTAKLRARTAEDITPQVRPRLG